MENGDDRVNNQLAQSHDSLRFGYISNPSGVVPDTKCAECHPRNVRLMHKHLTGVGQAKTRELTQGMINLAVDCQPDGKGSFVCRPRPDTQCFGCHAVSLTEQTLSLIDIEEMKQQKKDDEVLGHGCLTCHPPRASKDHHLTGNIRAITKRASQAFPKGCRSCHAEGLKKITSGGSPHSWLARYLEGRENQENGDRP